MNYHKTVLITGFTGQDGTFLTKWLLDEGYRVVGLVRRISTEPPHRVRGKFDFSEAINDGRLMLEQGDLLSVDSLIRILLKYKPVHIYNLAAQSHVGTSFTQPEFTIQADFLGVVNLITAVEALVGSGYSPRIYQASTSEMFGDRPNTETLNEKSSLEPRSPYAIAKTAAHYYCRMKRDQGMFICSGILFNHESEIRGGDFVTQKIARGVDRWRKTGQPIALGNLNASRDWGYAGDYVRAMYLMLLQDRPTDYVVATGKTHTVREFCEAAFKAAYWDVEWRGEGQDEVGIVDNKVAVVVDAEYYRPNEVGYLHGDASKIQQIGWQPEYTFEELVRIMVEPRR
jgi:GDPmannose 4,6-dehydratase